MKRSLFLFNFILRVCSAERLPFSGKQQIPASDDSSISEHERDISSDRQKNSRGNEIDDSHRHKIQDGTCKDEMPCLGATNPFIERRKPYLLSTMFSTTTIYITVTQTVPQATETINSTVIDTVTVTEPAIQIASKAFTVTSSLAALSNHQNRLLAPINGLVASAPVLGRANHEALSKVLNHKHGNSVHDHGSGHGTRPLFSTVTSVITVTTRTVVTVTSGTASQTNTVRVASTLVVTSTHIPSSTAPSSSIISTAVPDTSLPSDREHAATAMAIIAVMAAFVTLALVLGVLYVYTRRKRQARNTHNSQPSFGDFCATSHPGNSPISQPKPARPRLLRNLLTRANQASTDSSEKNHPNRDYSRRSKIDLVPNLLQTLEGQTKQAQQLASSKASVQAAALRGRKGPNHISTTSESIAATRHVLQPPAENMQRSEAVRAKEEPEPTAGMREWQSSAWAWLFECPNTPSSRTVWTTRTSLEPPLSADLWNMLLPDRRSGDLGALQQQQQKFVIAAEAAAFNGDGKYNDSVGLEIPSPVASSNVLGSSQVDVTLSVRSSAEAEFWGEARAKIHSVGDSETVVGVQALDNVYGAARPSQDLAGSDWRTTFGSSKQRLSWS